MKKNILILTVFILATVTFNLSAQVVEITPFIFLDRFPENSFSIGFPKERVIQVGAIINSGETKITEVTVVNLKSGLSMKARVVAELKKIWSNLYLVEPLPTFDPNSHLGIWEIRAIDDKGEEYTAKSHNLDITDEMPYVGNAEISGNLLAPTISWDSPTNVPEKCRVRYRVRLLKNSDNQFYMSKYLDESNHTIPEGKLKQEDLKDTYVRIEAQCFDSSEPQKPSALELKSETFIPLNKTVSE